MFDILEVILIIFNLVLFLFVWKIFVCMAYIHDMVKFFIYQKLIKDLTRRKKL